MNPAFWGATAAVYSIAASLIGASLPAVLVACIIAFVTCDSEDKPR